MPTFQSPKKVGEIQEAKLLPEDWYLVRVVRQPRELPNNNAKEKSAALKMKIEEVLADPACVENGAGRNWRINLRVQHDNPDYHGRPLMVNMPLPSVTVYPDDHEEFPGELVEEHMFNEISGRTVYDEKFERLAIWSASFAGYAYEEMGDETEMEISQGAEAMIYVSQAEDFRDPERITNQIDIFNSYPRVAE